MLWTIKANGKRQRNIHLLFLRHRQQPEIVAGYCGGFWRSRAVQNDTVSWNHRIGLPNRRFYIPRIYGRTARLVRRFLESYPFRKGVYYFSIGTYYTYKGCAVSVVDKIMSGKGVRLDYGYNLPTVGNCLKEYEVSSVRRTKILERRSFTLHE